jgi:hypothetical protein
MGKDKMIDDGRKAKIELVPEQEDEASPGIPKPDPFNLDRTVFGRPALRMISLACSSFPVSVITA